MDNIKMAAISGGSFVTHMQNNDRDLQPRGI